MANGTNLPEILKFRRDWHADPIPPWLFEILDQRVLFDLARISLERTRDVQKLDLAATEKAIALINKVKF
jgi:hypothetical protein